MDIVIMTLIVILPVGGSDLKLIRIQNNSNTKIKFLVDTLNLNIILLFQPTCKNKTFYKIYKSVLVVSEIYWRIDMTIFYN